MSQFYTTEQMNALGTFLGEELKQTRSLLPNPATDISSFMEALDHIQTPTHFLNIPITTPIFVGTPQT